MFEMIPESEIEFVNGDMILVGLIIIVLIIIWDLTRIKSQYTKSKYECLRCGYEFESRYNSIVDLIMFLHRIVCRGKENDK